MRLNYLHEVVEQGLIELKYIDTLNQVADILTKLLGIQSHEHFTDILTTGHHGVIPSPKAKIVYKSKKPNKFKSTSDGQRKYKYGPPTLSQATKPSTGKKK
jgi:hypothetical protein